LREGISISDLSPAQIAVLEKYPEQVEKLDNQVVLTPQGRLIADRIVRELI
jgi:oxygen-independent coproporphyrinogen-3 oxidase